MKNMIVISGRNSGFRSCQYMTQWTEAGNADSDQSFRPTLYNRWAPQSAPSAVAAESHRDVVRAFPVHYLKMLMGVFCGFCVWDRLKASSSVLIWIVSVCSGGSLRVVKTELLCCVTSHTHQINEQYITGKQKCFSVKEENCSRVCINSWAPSSWAEWVIIIIITFRHFKCWLCTWPLASFSSYF